MPTTPTPQSKTATAASWKKSKRHPITLTSGVVVGIEIPNIPLLVKTGQLPNELVTEALGNIAKGKLTPEIISQQSEFYDKIVVLTVKEPEITEADVHELPFEDIELIVEIATRQRDLDATGAHVGGLNSNKEWRTFRGLTSGDEDVESVFGS
jgi:hypothetical protein